MPSTPRTGNLLLAFLFEIGVLIAVGLWGYRLLEGPALLPRVFVVVLAVSVMALAWGIFGAPKAAIPLHGLARLLFVLLWFGVGAMALVSIGWPRAGVAFFVLCLVNLVMVRRPSRQN